MLLIVNAADDDIDAAAADDDLGSHRRPTANWLTTARLAVRLAAGWGRWILDLGWRGGARST